MTINIRYLNTFFV